MVRDSNMPKLVDVILIAQTPKPRLAPLMPDRLREQQLRRLPQMPVSAHPGRQPLCPAGQLKLPRPHRHGTNHAILMPPATRNALRLGVDVLLADFGYPGVAITLRCHVFPSRFASA